VNPLGFPLPGWTPPPRPGPEAMDGRFVRLERLTATHAAALHAAFGPDPALWDYMAAGPFPEAEAYAAWVRSVETAADPVFYTLLPRGSAPAGVASLMRIEPAMGCIEVGNITFGPSLQRTPAATEGLFLLMRWAFDAGYRRFEWKCNALNAPSRRAAQRLGFSYEGTFRQHMVVKGRNRDTAWFAIIDRDWPALRAAFETWLAPENFDAAGRQRVALGTLTAPCVTARDPSLSAAADP
jgi:RimJ/RimL family protein N-acetyltransferase